MCKDARKYDAVQCRSHPALRLQSDIKEEHEKRTRSPNSTTHTLPEANLTRETKTGEEIEMDKPFSRLSVYDSTLTATRLSNVSRDKSLTQVKMVLSMDSAAGTRRNW